jgi:hypothetical protein
MLAFLAAHNRVSQLFTRREALRTLATKKGIGLVLIIVVYT